jgi:hypothetical protein
MARSKKNEDSVNDNEQEPTTTDDGFAPADDGFAPADDATVASEPEGLSDDETQAEIDRLMGSTGTGPVDDADDGEFSVEGMDQVDSKFVVPKGIYDAKCISIKSEISKSSGHPMIVFVYVLTSGGVHAGKEFTIWATKKPTALFAMKNTLRPYGINVDQPVVKFRKEQVLNIAVRVEMIDDSYKDQSGEERKTSKIKRVLPAEG